MKDYKTLGDLAANEILMREGWFHGLHKLIRDYGLPPDRVAVHKANFFRLLHGKIVEGEREVHRLGQVLGLMKANCRDGMLTRPWEGTTAYGPASELLRQNMKAFDGWSVSLLETHISLLCAIENPESAGMRLNDLRTSFINLWNTRMGTRRPLDNHPGLFRGPYIFIP
ncbi:MAG TPA: hypothetical protein PKD24_11385 [Pyrinomonadaceae bacterium]|nr:hypothetical protein [Pyrinomonadaceae bacterium]HMP66118.1 hypothetical protein [Pyrinomonadaceae bacterium]